MLAFHPQRTRDSRRNASINAAWAGKDVTQPFAGFVHRGARPVDDADPEHEAMIDAVVARQRRLASVVLSLLA